MPKPRRFPSGTRPKPAERARNSILSAWRRVDLSSAEKERKLTAKSAGAILPAVLQELRWDRRRSEAEVVKVWNHLIDPTIAAHAQPSGLAKGTLFVSVDSSVWLNEIVRYHRREILARLQHSFGRDLIQRISFRTE